MCGRFSVVTASASAPLGKRPLEAAMLLVPGAWIERCRSVQPQPLSNYSFTVTTLGGDFLSSTLRCFESACDQRSLQVADARGPGRIETGELSDALEPIVDRIGV